MTNPFEDGESIEVESPAHFGTKPTPRREFDMPSFFDTFGQVVADSTAGTLARKGVWLMDAFHDSEAETYEEWRFTADVSNKAIPGRDETVGEMLEKAKHEVYDVLWSHFVRFCHMLGFEPPVSYEAGRDTRLWDLADYVVEYKAIWETYYGAKVEETVAETLSDALRGAEWYAHTEEIAARTEYDTPESAGIDLYFPDEDLTVQVKLGDGGTLDDCEAEIVARYKVPNHDWPHVVVQDN